MIKKLMFFITLTILLSLRANADNSFCQVLKGKQNPSGGAVVVAILEVNPQGIAKILTIGNPRLFLISLNDIDAKRTKLYEEDFKCNRKTVGRIEYFDLKKLNMDAGFLKVQADKQLATKSISFN